MFLPTLLISASIIAGCIGNNADKKHYNNEKTAYSNSQTDSIAVSVKLPPKRGCGFNISDQYYNHQAVDFTNETDKDTVITRKIPYLIQAPILSYRMIYETDSTRDYMHHDYILNENTEKLEFTYKDGDVSLVNESNVIIADELFGHYYKNWFHFFRRQKPFEITTNYLDSVYNQFKVQYQQDKQPQLVRLNKLYYIESLQKIAPYHKRVETFVTRSNHKDYILNSTGSIFKSYLKTRINHISFDTINKTHYNFETMQLFAIGMYQLFKDAENTITPQKYPAAREWLTTTDFYAKNKELVDQTIYPKEKKEFTTMLSNLIVLDKDLSKSKFSKVVQANPSEYYLLDLWATWCRPCLEGMQLIHEMEIPNNVKVINLGTDKRKNTPTWQKRAKNHKISYLIDLNIAENREFLKYIELKSIPRYILIDNNMNLIDEAFFRPTNPDFLKTLNNIQSFYEI
jgi:thiol-disulfide isomerase/thioredoxin